MHAEDNDDLPGAIGIQVNIDIGIIDPATLRVCSICSRHPLVFNFRSKSQ